MSDNWTITKEYKQEWINAAKRRIEGMIKEMGRYDISLKRALASAYMQGIADAVDLEPSNKESDE